MSHGSVHIDPSVLSSLASRLHVETLGLASNGGCGQWAESRLVWYINGFFYSGLFLYQMSPSTFVRLLNSKVHTLHTLHTSHTPPHPHSRPSSPPTSLTYTRSSHTWTSQHCWDWLNYSIPLNPQLDLFLLKPTLIGNGQYPKNCFIDNYFNIFMC